MGEHKHALVVDSHGRHFGLEYAGKVYQGTAKGKNISFVVGDLVSVDILNDTQARILELVPRTNLVYRSDYNKSKMIAANLSQILIVIAIKPSFNRNFLNACLLCAEAGNIKPIIVINKMDLPGSDDFAIKIKQLYQNMLKYAVIEISAANSCAALTTALQHERSLLIGQSGVGKSTITNQVYPLASAKTGEIARYETSGRHTTSHATLYHINDNSDLIDCPGLQEFGLYHLNVTEVSWFFREMKPHLGQCKFHNCLHLNEPGCIIRELVAKQTIDLERYNFYCRLIEMLKTKKHY